MEGHLYPDHVHMLIAIPPKYSVAQVVGYIKGKSAIAIARNHDGRKRNYTGESFWARGYYVSTVGWDEAAIRRYISKQEAEDNQLEQRYCCEKNGGFVSHCNLLFRARNIFCVKRKIHNGTLSP